MPISHEQFSQHLPPELGTSPLPEGHTRYYHQTDPENVESIREHGLQAGRYREKETGPRGVWIGEKPFYGDRHHDTATVELSLPTDRTRARVDTTGDVHPSQILAIHEPWHHHARNILADPDITRDTVAGHNDFMADYDPHYGKAIEYVKRLHGVEP